jgi:hypothetical protein
MRFGPGFEEHVRQILEFPNRGDLRSVRPSIRVAEVAVRRNPPLHGSDHSGMSVFEVLPASTQLTFRKSCDANHPTSIHARYSVAGQT